MIKERRWQYSAEKCYKPKVAHLEWLLSDYSELSTQNKVILYLWTTMGKHREMLFTHFSFTENESRNYYVRL